MVNDIDDLTAGLPDGKETQMNIYSSNQWPMPFYLRKYKRTLWWGDKVTPEDAPIIITQTDQANELNKAIKKKYKINQYTLRSGVLLLLYIDEDYFKNKRSQLAQKADKAKK